MTITPIATRDQLDRLITRILDPMRTGTITVFSVDRHHRPHFDLDAYATAVADMEVDAYLLADPADGEEFTRRSGLDCYNGAACISPADKRPTTIIPDRGDADQRLARRTIQDSHPMPSAATDVRTQLKAQRTENKRLRSALKKHRTRKPASPIPPADTYPAEMADEWAKLAVRVTWALDTSPEDKRHRPLPDEWDIEFQAARTIRDSRNPMDMLRCIVRILTGTARSHQLMSNGNGSRPALGPWGNVIQRAYVKSNSPNAARIHYTRDHDGRIVIIAAGGHDELI